MCRSSCRSRGCQGHTGLHVGLYENASDRSWEIWRWPENWATSCCFGHHRPRSAWWDWTCDVLVLGFIFALERAWMAWDHMCSTQNQSLSGQNVWPLVSSVSRLVWQSLCELKVPAVPWPSATGLPSWRRAMDCAARWWGATLFSPSSTIKEVSDIFGQLSDKDYRSKYCSTSIWFMY